jgi:hypothetical protein
MSLIDRTNETVLLAKHKLRAKVTIDRDFDDNSNKALREPPWVTIDVIDLLDESCEIFLRVTPEEAKNIRDRLTLVIESFGSSE